MTVYKIRRKADGLFAVGGSEVRFSKQGKAWTNLAALKSHLILVGDNLGRRRKLECWRLTRSERYTLAAEAYAGCEVVAYEHVEGAVVPLERFAEPAD